LFGKLYTGTSSFFAFIEMWRQCSVWDSFPSFIIPPSYLFCLINAVSELWTQVNKEREKASQVKLHLEQRWWRTYWIVIKYGKLETTSYEENLMKWWKTTQLQFRFSIGTIIKRKLKTSYKCKTKPFSLIIWAQKLKRKYWSTLTPPSG